MANLTPRESIWRALCAGVGAELLGGLLLGNGNGTVVTLAVVLLGLGTVATMVGAVALGVSLGLADRDHRRPVASPPHPLLSGVRDSQRRA